MKTTIFESKTSGRIIKVQKLDNGQLLLQYPGGAEVENAGSIIVSCGGVDGFLARCREIDGTLDEYMAEREAQKEAAKAAKQARQAAKELEETTAAKDAYDSLIAQFNGEAIPATMANIKVIAKYLQTVNWGMWGTLPRLTVGYTANQYNCDGQKAVTFTFDEPVNGATKLVYGAPVGHLNNYERIR